MPVIGFTQKDILRSTLVEPGWYHIKIDAIGEKPSKDGGSINYPVEATIIKSMEDGSEKFAGVPLDWNFNSKAIGFAIGFLKALGVDVQPNSRFDLANAAGKELQVMVENEEYQGNMKNRVNHKYRALEVA